MIMKMTIVNLLEYFYDQIFEALKSEDEEKLNYLSITASEMLKAAQNHNDSEISELFDDFCYVLNETLMGAKSKAKEILPDVKNKINLLKVNDQ